MQDAIHHAPREQHKCLEMKEDLERFLIGFNDKFIMEFDLNNDPQTLDGSLRRNKVGLALDLSVDGGLDEL